MTTQQICLKIRPGVDHSVGVTPRPMRPRLRHKASQSLHIVFPGPMDYLRVGRQDIAKIPGYD